LLDVQPPEEADPLQLPLPLLLLVDVSAPEELPVLNLPRGTLSGAPAAHATKAMAPASAPATG